MVTIAPPSGCATMIRPACWQQECTGAGVDVELPADVGGGDFLQLSRLPYGRRRHQGVEPGQTSAIVCSKRSTRHVLLVGHVGGECGGIASRGLKFGYGLRGCVGRRAVVKRDGISPRGKRTGDRIAYAPLATAGY